jgi:hypothetical protein
MSGWEITVGKCDLGGVSYIRKGEVTYGLVKMDNFVIYKVDIT